MVSSELVAEEMRITRRPEGPAVRGPDVTALKVGQLIEDSLTAELLDDRGWSGIVEDHPNVDPAAVDAR